MEDALFKLLDRPIAFHRPFVSVTGSVQAALMLSQAIYWSRRTNDAEGWFYKTAIEWEEETGLTKYEQEGARKHLRATGFWFEKLKGVPAKLHFKVDKSALFSSLGKNTKLDQFSEKQETSIGKNGNVLYTETTTETTSDELKSSSSQQPLFSDSIPRENGKEKTNKKKAAGAAEPKDEYFGLLKAVWLKHYPVLGFNGGADGKAIKSITGKLKHHAEAKGYPLDPATISGAFDYVLEYIRVRNPGHWCNGKPLTTVNSQLTSILHELAVGTTKPVNPNSRNAADIISAFE